MYWSRITRFTPWILLILVSLSGCVSSNPRLEARDREERQVGTQQDLYTRTQPPPFFNWSLQRHLMVEFYKAQNQATATYSYVLSPFTGAILFECQSVGFPITGGTSLTNPEQTNGIAQAEPNGLYPPLNSAATYVMCLNEDGTVAPTYVEQDVLTFTRPMTSQNGQLVPRQGSISSVRIPVRDSELSTSPPAPKTKP